MTYLLLSSWEHQLCVHDDQSSWYVDLEHEDPNNDEDHDERESFSDVQYLHGIYYRVDWKAIETIFHQQCLFVD
jgi:hypothetical protein